MNKNDLYKNKYLKYKNKYLSLKSMNIQQGGNPRIKCDHIGLRYFFNLTHEGLNEYRDYLGVYFKAGNDAGTTTDYIGYIDISNASSQGIQVNMSDNEDGRRTITIKFNPLMGNRTEYSTRWSYLKIGNSELKSGGEVHRVLRGNSYTFKSNVAFNSTNKSTPIDYWCRDSVLGSGQDITDEFKSNGAIGLFETTCEFIGNQESKNFDETTKSNNYRHLYNRLVVANKHVPNELKILALSQFKDGDVLYNNEHLRDVIIAVDDNLCKLKFNNKPKYPSYMKNRKKIGERFNVADLQLGDYY